MTLTATATPQRIKEILSSLGVHNPTVIETNPTYLLSFVETPRKFIIAELSIRKLGSSSVLIILMKIRAYESKALQ